VLRATRFGGLARGLIACFLVFVFVFTATRCAAFLALALALVRLADFLRAELTFVRAFPRFVAVLFCANARCFRLAMTVSLLESSANVSASANRCAHPGHREYTRMLANMFDPCGWL
jgi:hypothetical protein